MTEAKKPQNHPKTGAAEKSYQILKPIAMHPRYDKTRTHCNGQFVTKITILESAIKHVKFLEDKLEETLNQEPNSLTLKSYRDKFASDLFKEYSIKTPLKKRVMKNEYCITSENDSEQPQDKSFDSPCQKKTKLSTKCLTTKVLKSSTEFSSDDFSVTRSQETTLKFKNKFEKVPKAPEKEVHERGKTRPKCKKNLENEFEKAEIATGNDIRDFDGFYKFYQTMTSLLENVLPSFLITSEHTRRFIQSIWGEFPQENRLNYISLATESEKENELSKDLNDKSSGFLVLEDEEVLPDSWDTQLSDISDLIDFPDFNFDDLKPYF